MEGVVSWCASSGVDVVGGELSGCLFGGVQVLPGRRRGRVLGTYWRWCAEITGCEEQFCVVQCRQIADG